MLWPDIILGVPRLNDPDYIASASVKKERFYNIDNVFKPCFVVADGEAK